MTCSVTLYEESNYRGKTRTYTTTQPTLEGGFEGKISSWKVDGCEDTLVLGLDGKGTPLNSSGDETLPIWGDVDDLSESVSTVHGNWNDRIWSLKFIDIEKAGEGE